MKKTKSFFDYSEKEKKRILTDVTRESNKAQWKHIKNAVAREWEGFDELPSINTHLYHGVLEPNMEVGGIAHLKLWNDSKDQLKQWIAHHKIQWENAQKITIVKELRKMRKGFAIRSGEHIFVNLSDAIALIEKL